MKTLQWIALFLCLLLTPGCLLRPDGGGGGVTGQQYWGLVVLEDFRGASESADAYSWFRKVAETKSLASVRATEETEGRLRPFHSSSSRNEPCKFTKLTRAAEEAPINQSVGRLTIGPRGDKNPIELRKSADNRYSVNLQPGFPMGVYEVSAEGDEDRKPFKQLMFAPYQIDDVTYNGLRTSPFESITLDRNKDLKITWRSPEKLVQGTVMSLMVLQKVDGRLTRLTCQATEESLFVKGKFSMTIPQASLKPLVAGAQTEVYFERIFEVLNKTENYKALLIQGIRSWANPATVS